MNIQNYISDFSDVEAYNASTLNYYVFCLGFDERQGLLSSVGIIMRDYRFDYTLQDGKHINILGKKLSFNQYFIAA